MPIGQAITLTYTTGVDQAAQPSLVGLRIAKSYDREAIVGRTVAGTFEAFENEKQAWRNVFEYYVFGPPERAAEHLPDAARGPLAPIDDDMARTLRAMLISKLNR